MSLKSAPPISPGRRSDPSSSLASRSSFGRNQDNFSIGDSRRLHNQGSSPLLSTWNGGGSSTSVGSENFLLSLPPPSSSSRTPSAGGAVSMPSSPRLGRRTYGSQEPTPTSRTRKYSAGSLSGMTGVGHSRSLPRLCPAPSPHDNNNGVLTLSTLPPRRSDTAGDYKFSKEHCSKSQNADLNHKCSNSSQQAPNKNKCQATTQGEGVVSISLSSPKTPSSTPQSIPSTSTPPDVTIPSRAGGSSSPRVAKKLSLTSTSSIGSVSSIASSPPEPEWLSSNAEMSLAEQEKPGKGFELTGAAVLGLGERSSSFGKAGLETGIGLGERRQSFGKAGVTPPGGFRERRGSISSLSGKEELTDYHHRQKEERLREQEVERLVSFKCLYLNDL